MKTRYTAEAVDDLVRLRAFMEEKNPRAAQRVAQSIKKNIKQLEAFPLIGVGVEEAPDPEIIRDLITDNYIVRYLVYSNEVRILRIWHQKESRF